MKRTITVIAIALIVVSAVSVSGTVYAKDRVTVYRVTVTNITKGQIISPPIVISHNRYFQLFNLGDPAPIGLDALAEDGNPEPLRAELGSLGSVYDLNVAGGGIPPGDSATIEIKTKRGFRYLSAAGMLISTNDAFFAIRGIYASSWRNAVVDARAYDAGSELNSEMCEFVPGPTTTDPCPTDEVGHDPSESEGYVYLHSGIHGIADLSPAEFDWRNPVAMVTIERIK